MGLTPYSTPYSVRDWIPNKINKDYSITPDYDNDWRTGGSLEEILDESHMTAPWIMKGLKRFVGDRDQRIARLRAALDSMS